MRNSTVVHCSTSHRIVVHYLLVGLRVTGGTTGYLR